MHVDPKVLALLRESLGRRFALCYDHVIGGRRPDPEDHSTALRAREHGTAHAAVGKPFLARKKMRVLTKVLRADRARIGSGKPRELLVWTLNDEVELRRVIGVGVDAILTDVPGRLRRIVDELAS
ncbi:MAG: hypothetical protein AAGE52_38380 [Myxococcota bacterium]